MWYANGDRPSQLIDPAILNDRTIYPDAATMANFYTIIAHDAKTQRLINRLWTRDQDRRVMLRQLSADTNAAVSRRQ